MKCTKWAASRWRGPCLTAAAAFLLSLTSVSLSATPVSGVANINGTVTVGTAGVDFFNNVGVANVFNAAPSTGSYAGLTGGTIDNLTGPTVTGPISIPSFATFTVPTGTIFFDLTNIFAGVGTAANCGNNSVGSVCTPTNSRRRRPASLSRSLSRELHTAAQPQQAPARLARSSPLR